MLESNLSACAMAGLGWTRNPMDWIHELEETGRKPKDERVTQ